MINGMLNFIGRPLTWDFHGTIRFGTNVRQRLREGLAWFKMSADQGYASAQNSLGDCYYEGKGVEQDYRKAIEWYQKAAGQGYDEAQYHLGDCYYHGEGVEQDYGKAVAWYRKGVEREFANPWAAYQWANVIVTVPASNKIVNKL